MTLPPKGHNNPPDPIEAVIAEWDSTITEAQTWADGEPVTDEASMNAVDRVIKEFRSYRTALATAGKERTEPAHKLWKAEVALVKVYTDDADLMQSALTALVGPFKAKLVAEKEAARKAAWEAADEARRESEAQAAQANAGSIDDMRAVEAAKQAAMDAQKAASVAQKDTVKNMRTKTHYEVLDMRALVNWIATNDKPAMATFAEAYAHKNHADIPDAIVRTWATKEAF